MKNLNKEQLVEIKIYFDKKAGFKNNLLMGNCSAFNEICCDLKIDRNLLWDNKNQLINL